MSSNGETADLCLTKECLSTAAYMMGMMDAKANPCNDFYQFSCGGWLEKNTIPASRSSWSMDSEIKRERDLNLRTIMESPIERQGLDSAERKVKTLYQTCLKVDAIDALGIQPLTDVMKRFGGWALSGM